MAARPPHLSVPADRRPLNPPLSVPRNECAAENAHRTAAKHPAGGGGWGGWGGGGRALLFWGGRPGGPAPHSARKGAAAG